MTVLAAGRRELSAAESVPQQEGRQIALLPEILGNGEIHASLQQKPADAFVDVVADHPQLALPSGGPHGLHTA